MPTNLVEKIDVPKPTNASCSGLAADAALVIAAQNGNEQAFEMLVKRHEQRILAVAHSYTRAREDAQDVVQQTFQNAFVHLHSFEGKSSFSTWLTRIAINQALMLLRHRRGMHEVPVGESSDREETSWHLEMPDSSSDPEANCARRERAQILTAALGNLRPGVRRAIELRELGELSTSDTAQLMGLSVGAVKARIFHGKRKLRGILRRCMTSHRTFKRNSSSPKNGPGHVSQDLLASSACG